jgi:hypothetical protein
VTPSNVAAFEVSDLSFRIQRLRIRWGQGIGFGQSQ